MKHAILIDATARTVAPVELDETLSVDGQMAAYYALLGCEQIELVSLPNGDVGYVDEEGLLKHPEHFFMLPDVPSPLTGRMVIHGVSYDDDGDDHIEDAKASVRALAGLVEFMSTQDNPALRDWVAQFA